MHLPDNIAWNVLSSSAATGRQLINVLAVYNSARKLSSIPQTRLRIEKFLLIAESSKIKNMFPAPLRPLREYILEALRVGAILAHTQEIPLFIGTDSVLG